MPKLVINLLGCPGAGKSTGSAYIFSKLKMAGINAELVTEFAKEKAWENNKIALSDQLYILGNQHYKMKMCFDKVEVIVTDSPLILSAYYNKNDILGEDFNKLVVSIYKSFKNMTYLINRTKKYNPAGRFQTEEESDKIKQPLIDLLNKNQINFIEKNGSLEQYDEIIDEVLYVYNKLKSKEAMDKVFTKDKAVYNKIYNEIEK